MSIFINSKGTSSEFFKINQSTIYPDSTDPTGSYSVVDGDVWIDTINGSFKVRKSSAWEDITFDDINTVGSISTGGESSPDVSPGGVCIQINAEDGNALTFKSTDVSHPFTNISEEDTFGLVDKVSNVDGGLHIRGNSSGNTAALYLHGSRETLTTADLGGGAVDIDGRKSDGGTGTVAAASNENIISIKNNGTTKVVVKGNGDLVTQGELYSSGLTPNQVLYAGTGGVISGDTGFTYNDSTNALVVAGEVGINRTSTGVTYTSLDQLVVGDSTSSHGIVIESGITNEGALTFGDDALAGRISYYHASDSMTFQTIGIERLRIASSGSIGTGGEVSPDVDPGGICVQTNGGDGNALTFKNTDVSHPFTGFAEEDTYGMFDKVDNLNGGLHIRGNSSSSVASLLLMGSRQTPSTPDTAVGVVDITGRKSDGLTGAAALADGENLLSVSNNGTVNLVIKGNGDVVTQGFLYSSTPSGGDNSTKVATTAYVQGEISNKVDRTWYITTTTYNANAGDFVACDTSGGSFSVVLPSSPSLGDTVGVLDASSSFGIESLTIDRNGENIMGIAQDMAVHEENAAFELVYINATFGWRIF